MERVVSIQKLIRIEGNIVFAIDFNGGASEYSISLPEDQKDTEGRLLNTEDTYVLRIDENSTNFIKGIEDRISLRRIKPQKITIEDMEEIERKVKEDLKDLLAD